MPSCDLQLRSYSIPNLEFFCDFALRAAYYLNLPAFGPVPLPKITERWTVPKSHFIFKKSQENFERITRRRLIQIRDGHPETVQIWLAFLQKHAYYGIGMKANIWEYSKLGKLNPPKSEQGSGANMTARRGHRDGGRYQGIGGTCRREDEAAWPRSDTRYSPEGPGASREPKVQDGGWAEATPIKHQLYSLSKCSHRGLAMAGCTICSNQVKDGACGSVAKPRLVVALLRYLFFHGQGTQAAIGV